jgi:hypothetical protein
MEKTEVMGGEEQYVAPNKLTKLRFITISVGVGARGDQQRECLRETPLGVREGFTEEEAFEPVL